MARRINLAISVMDRMPVTNRVTAGYLTVDLCEAAIVAEKQQLIGRLSWPHETRDIETVRRGSVESDWPSEGFPVRYSSHRLG